MLKIINQRPDPDACVGNAPKNYTQYFNKRFPKTISGAQTLLIQRAKKKICANRFNKIIMGLSGGAEDIDITPDMGRFGDKAQTWYERNVRIGNFEIKTDAIYVKWDNPKCSSCFSFSTTMFVLENTGDNRLGPGFRERLIRMGEWPISGRGCCDF